MVVLDELAQLAGELFGQFGDPGETSPLTAGIFDRGKLERTRRNERIWLAFWGRHQEIMAMSKEFLWA